MASNNRDQPFFFPIDYHEPTLVALKAALADDGFTTYETTVGGSGFGILLSRGTGGEKTELAEGGAARVTVPDEARFRIATADELAHWASEAGSWAFV